MGSSTVNSSFSPSCVMRTRFPLLSKMREGSLPKKVYLAHFSPPSTLSSKNE